MISAGRSRRRDARLREPIDNPRAIKDHRVGQIGRVDVEGVLELLHHRVVALVERKPRAHRHASGVQDPRELAKVEVRVRLEEMREHRPRDEERYVAVADRERQMSGRARRIEHVVEHVVVPELESVGVRSEVLLAPLDHPLVTIDA